MSPTISKPFIEKKVNKTVVKLEQGDLTALAVDAVVYYARDNLELGAGHGAAIQSRGGAAVKKELEKIGGILMGRAVITTAGNMNARHIIHACGPKFQEFDTETKLGKCMRSALRVAADAGLKTVAFPPMGAGFYGVPLELCARVMLDSIREFLQDETPLEEIIICAVDKREFSAFEQKLAVL